MSVIKFFQSHLLPALGFALITSAAVFAPAANDGGSSTGDNSPTSEEKRKALEEDVTQGALRVVRDDGTVVECPLRHTNVEADVSGFIARVKVTQTFYNPTDERVEAVYVFPLPHEAAVDDMTLVIGDRKIVGLIKRRTEARRIYEEALAAGQTAALLEQERPNIFTQSVGNIDPGQEVNIDISYVDVLNYDMGTYEFHFPMVVGPRFIPGAPVSSPQPTPAELTGKVSPPVPDTTRVPDASRITPPVLKPGHRNGHDISLSLRLDAGVPIRGLTVSNHEANIVRQGESGAMVTLSPADSIPNKDFVLRYHVTGKKPEMSVMAHTGDSTDARRLGHGYFMLMVQPKEDERLTKSPPREIVFLLDVSGSMRGQPTEKVKESMREMLKLCREIDTMQVITFAGQTQQLFDKPVPVNPENVAQALNFTQGIQGSGGTYMLQGVKRAIDQPIDKERVRIVIMLTDGYIGNETEIIQHVGQHCGDQVRFWAIGIGSSPNMFLVDGVARQGGGMGKKLGLNENADGLAEEVITRIQRAQLAKIKIDWGNLEVAETYPAKIPELWAGRPVILFGRYRGSGATEIKLEGVVEGEPVSWPLQIALPQDQPSHDVLAKVWARKKIEDLMQQTYYVGSPAVEEAVTAIALDYRLMSQFTSFVAVDANDAEEIAKQRPAQPPRRMLVPVPLPEGTQWEGFFGPRGEREVEELRLASTSGLQRRKSPESIARGGGLGGMGGGFFGGAAFGPMPSPQPMRRVAGRLTAGRPMTTHASSVLMFRQQAGQGPGLGIRPVGDANDRSNGASYAFSSRFSLGYAQPAERDRSAIRGFTPALLAEAKDEDAVAVDGAYTANALAAGTEQIVKTAQRLLEAGRKHKEANEYDEARSDLVRAYFLATAAANRGNYQAMQTSGEALADLESLHADRVATWTKEMPELGTKLGLVLRDVSVGEALDAVAQAAELKVRFLKGSTQDSSEMLAGRAARVTYLDLRGASVAQALDWILHPLRLTWQPEQSRGAGMILAGSDRRMQRTSAWVYDVSAIALPSQKELEKTGDGEKAVAKAKEEAEQFVDAVRGALRASDEEIAWYAPGHLLVIGSPQRHEKMAGIVAQLSDPTAEPAGTLAALHGKASQRAKERREQVEQFRQRNRLMEVAAVHEACGWSLLAAALGGELDMEALTELQIAWKADETKRLLEGKGAGIALRSAWAVTTASRALSDEGELSSLAESVRDRCRPAADKAVVALEENPQDVPAVLAAAYAAMTMNDQNLHANVLARLREGTTESGPTGVARLAARNLLCDSTQINTKRLLNAIGTGGVTGEDVTVLFALACHRAGGDAWTDFRARMRDLLGEQPLPGSVVVLVNRLGGNVLHVAGK